MNRTRFALVAFTFAVVMAFAAAASATPSVGTLEFSAGYAKSSNDMTGSDESLGGGITFGAAYWGPVSPMVRWGAEVSYDNLGSLDYNNGTTTDNTISSHVFRVNPALRVNFGAPVGPSFFAQAGAGLYSVSAKVEDSVLGTASDNESKFGFNIGAGVGFPVGPKTKMNIMGNYHSVSTEGESLNYLQFHAGLGISI